MSNLLNIVCPTGCGASTLAVVKFSKCAPETNAAGIQRIFWTNYRNDLTDWTSAAEWVTRLSNTSTSASAIRTIHVVGSKPAPASTNILISLNRTIYGKKTHKLLIKIDETTDENYAMLRANECNPTLQLWYESTAPKLFGGNDGVVGTLKLDDIIVEDAGQIETFDGEFEWKSKHHAERITSPIAA